MILVAQTQAELMVPRCQDVKALALASPPRCCGLYLLRCRFFKIELLNYFLGVTAYCSILEFSHTKNVANPFI